TDIVEIVMLSACPHALLTARGSGVGTLLASEKNIFELIHSSIDEKQRGVLRRDERRAFHNRVTALCEKIEETPANVVTVHFFHGCALSRLRSLRSPQCLNFLSNGVLIVSKTQQSSKKTSSITRLQWGTQFPIFHFSCHSFMKRGPVRLFNHFIGQFYWN